MTPKVAKTTQNISEREVFRAQVHEMLSQELDKGYHLVIQTGFYFPLNTVCMYMR